MAEHYVVCSEPCQVVCTPPLVVDNFAMQAGLCDCCLLVQLIVGVVVLQPTSAQDAETE